MHRLVYFNPEDGEEEKIRRDEQPSEECSIVINIEEQEEHSRIASLAHTLQLVVGDGLKECSVVKSAIFEDCLNHEIQICLVNSLRLQSIIN